MYTRNFLPVALLWLTLVAGCQSIETTSAPITKETVDQPAAKEAKLELVCNAGYYPCVGQYGSSCYSPSSGQSCTQGLICNNGYFACIKGGTAQCYSPSSGQTCY